MLGFLAIASAVATGFLLLVEVVATPANQLPGLLSVTALCGATFVSAALLLRIGRWSYGLNIAGVILMMLGIEAGEILRGRGCARPRGDAASRGLVLGDALIRQLVRLGHANRLPPTMALRGREGEPS